MMRKSYAMLVLRVSHRDSWHSGDKRRAKRNVPLGLGMTLLQWNVRLQTTSNVKRVDNGGDDTLDNKRM
jgi:hypothetical protein